MKIVNRKFHREYSEIEAIEAGISLYGSEVKSIRKGGLDLDNSYIKLMDKGAFLINAQIPIYKYAKIQDYDPKRSRKLLLHKKELLKLKTKMTSGGLTIAAKSCYNKGPLIKLEIALVKGRKDIEKRKLEKNRDIKRNEKREVKDYMKG